MLRQTRLLSLALALTSSLALPGCGGSGGGPVALANVPAEFVDAVCTWQTRCHAFTSKSACEKVVFADVDSEVGSAQAGRATYDAAKAGDCIDSIRDTGCSVLAVFDALNSSSCEQVFTGTVAVGGTCITNVDCAANGRCEHTGGNCDPDVSCCMGTCTAGPAINQPVGTTCTSSNNCADGLYCKSATGGGTRSCTARITLENAQCDRQDSCASPLVCTGAEGANPTCRRLPAEGGTCDPALEIACNFIFDRCDPTTLKCVRQPSAGQPCQEVCIGDSSCKAGTCVANVGENAPCGGTNPECSGDLDCDEGTCKKPTPAPVCP